MNLKSFVTIANLKRNFQQARAQELFERNLNETMTDIEELEFLAEAGAEGLSSELVDYEDKKVKVIYAAGYPLKFLKTMINSTRITEDPSLWTLNRENYPDFSHRTHDTIEFSPETGEVSNTIATTYIDTDINPSMATSGATGVTYIFTHVKPDSVIGAGPNDIWSSPDMGDNKPILLFGEELMMPEEIARESIGNALNEVLLRRYDEAGNPLLPDALLSYNISKAGRMKLPIEEEVLKAAAYFDVPIIHIYHDAYTDEEPPVREIPSVDGWMDVVL